MDKEVSSIGILASGVEVSKVKIKQYKSGQNLCIFHMICLWSRCCIFLPTNKLSMMASEDGEGGEEEGGKRRT